MYFVYSCAHNNNRYTLFHTNTRNNVPRLHIACSKNVTPISLPSWLRVPFIKIAPATHFEYKPEVDMEVSDMSNSDKKLCSGDRMIDHSSGYERSGTVGTFMRSEDETRQQARCSPFNID